MSNKNNSPAQKAQWQENKDSRTVRSRFGSFHPFPKGVKVSMGVGALKKFAPTKQPPGYYEQTTDARHIHPRRLRANLAAK